MNGAPMTSRYAFPPNDLGYCGKPTFRKAILSFMDGSAGPKLLEREIRKFPVHYAYLRLIAGENGLQPFDAEVVRAFWIGNGLLEGIGRKPLSRFIARDLFRGKNPGRARKLADNLPEGILPHHSFNALYVNFVTDAVEKTARNYDSCCITWGEVLSLDGKRAVVDRESISWNGAFSLGKKRALVDLERSGVRLAGNLSQGDILSVHWGMAVQKISRRDAASLKKYTLMNMKAINGKGLV